MLPLTPVPRKPGERHSVGLGSGRGEAGSGAEALLPFALPLRPNSFVIITANRVLHCNADTPEEMHHWITLLQRSKGDTRVEGQEFIVRGKRRPRGSVPRPPAFFAWIPAVCPLRAAFARDFDSRGC